MNCFKRRFVVGGFIALSLGILFLFQRCSAGLDSDIVGTWEMTKYHINKFNEHKGIEVAWSFEKSGTFSQVIQYPNMEVDAEGTWLIRNDSTILIIYHNKMNEVEWKIAYLDESSLQVEHTTPGFFVEKAFKKN